MLYSLSQLVDGQEETIFSSENAHLSSLQWLFRGRIPLSENSIMECYPGVKVDNMTGDRSESITYLDHEQGERRLYP